MLTIAAVLSFWPARRGASALRAAGLVVLLVLYGTAVTEYDPGDPLARGFVLLLLLAAWLWLPRLDRRGAIVGAVIVLAVGIGAMPVADRLNRDVALVDYQSWNWFGGKDVVFDWNHSYGPLDWPREGTTLLNVRSDRPLYWKAETLETFDGLRWVRTDQNQSTSALGEIPEEADPKWLERVRVTVRSLRTDFVIVAGTPVEDDGLDGSLSRSSDGTIRVLGEPLERGDSYTINSYSPNPKPAELRAAEGQYDLTLSRYTRIGLPAGATPSPRLRDRGTTCSATRPQPAWRFRCEATLAGTSPGRAPSWRMAPTPASSDSPSGSPSGAPTAYAAVRNVEQYLQEGFTYNERPPTHPYPLNAFLFEDKLGYCQQFAGAMALMLRMSGIPSRVVSGFSPGSFNRDTGEYRVRDLDAHSWVEVFYPTIGWVTYDPTPTTSPAVTAGQGAEARDREGSAFSAPGGRRPRCVRSQPGARRRAGRRGERGAGRGHGGARGARAAAGRRRRAPGGLRLRRSRRLTPGGALRGAPARARARAAAAGVAAGAGLHAARPRAPAAHGGRAHRGRLRGGPARGALLLPRAHAGGPRAAARAAARAHRRARPARPPARIPRPPPGRAAAARLSSALLSRGLERLSITAWHERDLGLTDPAQPPVRRARRPRGPRGRRGADRHGRDRHRRRDPPGGEPRRRHDPARRPTTARAAPWATSTSARAAAWSRSRRAA